MCRKVSQVGISLNSADLYSGFKGIFSRQEDNFVKNLSDYLSSPHVFLTSSGIVAFYVILEALKKLSPRKEVILPAYTAPSMVLPVLKSGLKPVLCDISLSDFNIDLGLLSKVVTKDTLCLVPTHMFGIGISEIEDFKRKYPEIFIVEDCAQAMGTRIRGRSVGTFSDVSFFSFNRGKNLPTYGGGCITTNSDKLAGEISGKIKELPEQSLFFKVSIPFKILIFSLANRPFIYGVGHSFISRFKDNLLPKDFAVGKYTSFQAGVALSLLRKIGNFSQTRLNNGMRLIKELKSINTIIVPEITQGTEPAFTRLPILFKDLVLREKAEKVLWQRGIDTSRMYLKPIHQLFDLGYKKEDFPQANYFAERLLTLPVHPLVAPGDIDNMANVIKETVAC